MSFEIFRVLDQDGRIDDGGERFVGEVSTIMVSQVGEIQGH